jgi:hypothetical protein
MITDYDIAEASLDAQKIIDMKMREMRQEIGFAGWMLDVVHGFRFERAWWKMHRAFLYLSNTNITRLERMGLLPRAVSRQLGRNGLSNKVRAQEKG